MEDRRDILADLPQHSAQFPTTALQRTVNPNPIMRTAGVQGALER